MERTDIKKNKWIRPAEKAAAVLLALTVWQIVAMVLNRSILLASPVAVAARLVTLWGEAGFLSSIWFSFSRIVSGFLLALVAGIGLAVLAGRFRAAEWLLRPYMTAIKTVPVASFIVLALIWMSSRDLSVFIAFLMGLPVIYTNVLNGIKAVPSEMLDMANVFRVPWRRRFMYLWVPQIKPFLLSGCNVALGLCWKAGVAAEVIGLPRGSIGEQLYYAKLYINSTDLLAWTVMIVLASFLFEKLFVWLLKCAFGRWERL